MANLKEFLPILIPLVVLQLVLTVTALVHLHKHPNVKRGNRFVWILIVLLINIIGPILYFLFGREED